MWRKEKTHHLVSATKLSAPVSINATPKTRKPIIVGIVALFTALLVSGGSIITTSATAEAADYDITCPVFADERDNKLLADMGGLSTAQIRFLQTRAISENPVENRNPGGTFSESFGHQIQYVAWVPPAVNSSNTNVFRHTSFNTTWTSPGSGRTGVNALARAGGLEDVNVLPDFIGDKGWCRSQISGANISQTVPNMFLGMSKGVYNIIDSVYVIVMGGSINVTEVVGLNTNATSADTFDQLFVTERTENSWTQAIANQIEEALTGDNGLYSTLYLYFLLPVIFIGSVVVIVNLMRTKAVKGLTGIVWMILVVALGTVVLQAPMALPKFIDGAVGTIGNTAAAAITNATNNDDCIANNAKNDIDRDARAVSCQIWEATIYESWVSGQFGRTANNVSFDAAGGNGKNAIQNINGPAFSTAAHYAAGNNFTRFFTGEGRTFEAFVGFISISAIGAFVLGNAALLVAYQISMLLLIFTAPFFFLIGILPSQSGKGIFLRWVELIVALFVKRLVVTIFLAVFIKMFLLISDLDFLSLIMKTVLFIVLTYIGFSQRSKLIEMFAGKINFGGDKSINVGASLEKAAEKSGAVAVSAGLAGGAYVGGKAALGGKKLGELGVRQVRRGNLDKQLAKNKNDGAKQQQLLKNYVDKTGDTEKQNQFLGADGTTDFTKFNQQTVEREGQRTKRKEEFKNAASAGISNAQAFVGDVARKTGKGLNNLSEASGVSFAARMMANSATGAARKAGAAVAQSGVGKAAVFVTKQAVNVTTGLGEVGQAIGGEMSDMAKSVGQGVKTFAGETGEFLSAPAKMLANKTKQTVLKGAEKHLNNNPDFANQEKHRAAERAATGMSTFGGVDNHKKTSPVSFRVSPYKSKKNNS